MKITSIKQVAMEKLYKNAFIYNNLDAKQIEQLVKIAQNK